MEKTVSLSEFKSLYKGMWVARDLKTGKILATAKKLRDVAEKAAKITENYSVENVLPLNKAFMPVIR